MKAIVLDAPGGGVRLDDRPIPEPSEGEMLVRVRACGVCRTDLHVVDGDLPGARRPVVPGHQAVGVVEASRAPDSPFAPGDRVGVPWLAVTCGRCGYCTTGRENLCPTARFHGYTRDGGFAEAMTVDARFALPVPAGLGDEEAAPLLCAGLIGHRALRAAGEGRRLGLYGFGASAHIVCQIAVQRGQEVFAFVRPGDARGAAFARRLGAAWSGSSEEPAPEPLDAAIVFAPVGALVPAALRAVAPGGRVICAGIHMSDIPSFPYRDLWGERTIASVANLTRIDGREFMGLASTIELTMEIRRYPLEDAARALDDLREGRFEGAAVLTT